MNIHYKINHPVNTDQFVGLLKSSGLADRRPTHDYECMRGMIKNGNLLVSAWSTEKLVGIARSVTDFHYACYLSDLAVAQDFQRLGIGKKLQLLTQEQLGPQCRLILLAAPSANSYYEQLGFENNSRCWTLERNKTL